LGRLHRPRAHSLFAKPHDLAFIPYLADLSAYTLIAASGACARKPFFASASRPPESRQGSSLRSTTRRHVTPRHASSRHSSQRQYNPRHITPLRCPSLHGSTRLQIRHYAADRLCLGSSLRRSYRSSTVQLWRKTAIAVNPVKKVLYSLQRISLAHNKMPSRGFSRGYFLSKRVGRPFHLRRLLSTDRRSIHPADWLSLCAHWSRILLDWRRLATEPTFRG